MQVHSILWRRLNIPGHDACRLEHHASGYALCGTAVFRHNSAPVRLSYRLVGNTTWQTSLGVIRGFVGCDPVDLTIERSPSGRWVVNGQRVSRLDNYAHLDFSFTPASNFPQLRQLALAEGASADLPVVWLDLPCSRQNPADVLQVLPQHYERRGRLTYWYEAPSVDYAGLLELTPEGFIRQYPGLCEME